jgi:hypothetical protein
VVFEGEVWHPRCLLKSANEGLEDFRASQVAHVLPSRGNGKLHVTWSPPPCNGFKINWDAAATMIIWVESVVLCVRRWLMF